jgi:hypothetical protein
VVTVKYTITGLPEGFEEQGLPAIAALLINFKNWRRKASRKITPHI